MGSQGKAGRIGSGRPRKDRENRQSEGQGRAGRIGSGRPRKDRENRQWEAKERQGEQAVGG